MPRVMGHTLYVVVQLLRLEKERVATRQLVMNRHARVVRYKLAAVQLVRGGGESITDMVTREPLSRCPGVTKPPPTA